MAMVEGLIEHLEKLAKEQFVEVRGTNSEGRIYEFRGLCPPNIRTRACAGFKVWLASLAGEIKLYNGLRPSEKRAKARGEEPCYARW